MAPPQLELHLALAQGREAECARFLRAELRKPQWEILAALAAEIVAIHEAASQGAAVVVVVSAAEAKDLLVRGTAPAVR